MKGELKEAVNDLRSVLCDPEDRVCIDGSDADRAIVQRALDRLAALQPEGPPAMGVEEVALDLRQRAKSCLDLAGKADRNGGRQRLLGKAQAYGHAAEFVVTALSPQPVPARGEEGVG